MTRLIIAGLGGVAVCAIAFALLLPQARRAGAILAAQDDPVQLSDVQLDVTLRERPAVITENIEAALASGDADLAQSLVTLASDKNVSLPGDLTRRVAEASADQQSSGQMARQFARGFVTGNVEDAASLGGTVAGDLTVFGDVRDVLREGKHWVSGEETDRLVLGLATAGIAVTAATYVTVGGAAPVRAGLTLVKDARKVGRLGEGLAAWAGRSAREIVDTPALQNAVLSGSMLRPGETLSAIRTAFRAEKAGGLVRVAKDVGRIGEKAGTRGALDALAIAEGPKDIARGARLATAKGGQTRAIFKILGRGALLLAAGAFDLALWVLGAALALFGLLSSIKATTERLTLAWLARRKARRLRQSLIAPPALAASGRSV